MVSPAAAGRVSRPAAAVTDALGVPVLVGDVVTVVHRGDGVRLADCGRRAAVTGLTRAGNLVLVNPDGYVHDPIAGGRAVRPGCVCVARRDGLPGHQGNV